MTNGQRLDFTPTFYARFPLDEISPKEMDVALANGYFRNGIEYCSISARFMNNNWVSSVMLRLPIPDYQFKKRHRKLLKTNSLRFTTAIRPFVYTEEKETLWKQFKKTVHQWESVAQLDFHLLRGKLAMNFQMHEICVYDGDRLVAFSIFDLGSNSLASLEAAYDPEYASFSLGFYTMLLEIQFCREQGISHYYPGFLPRDVPMFNYKLRPGQLEFFRLSTKQWLPFEELCDADWLMEEVMDKLEVIKQLLASAHIISIEGFTMGTSLPSPERHILSNNIHLIVPLFIAGRNALFFITWDIVEGQYLIYEGTELKPELPLPYKTVHLFYYVQQHSFLGQFNRVSEVLAAMNGGAGNWLNWGIG